jgi:drug/metabolite transporter (DMT)-like permease
VKYKHLDGKTIALISMFFAIIIGGGTAAITKVALHEIPSFSFTFFRFVFAGISVLPFFLKSKPKFHKNIYKVILFSLFMTINVIFFPLGVNLTTATTASTLYVFGPIIVAVLSYFLFAEQFTMKKSIGVSIGFLGALLIILLPEISKGAPFVGNTTGNIIISVAVIGTALYTLFSKGFQKEYTPLQLTGIFIFTSCIVMIPLAATDLVSHPNWWNAVTESSLLAVLYVGILGTTLWYILYQYAIKHASPLIASMVLYLQPAATFIWAFFLLGEQLNTGLLIGAFLTFTGVYLTIQSKRKIKNSL